MQVSLASGALWALTLGVSMASSLALPTLPPGEETGPFTPLYRLAQPSPPSGCERYDAEFST
ncbi:MAG: hypothetical protein ABIP46_06710 [Polaromonas sp.]